MLRVFCVGSLAVTVEDIYFVDPTPVPGQEGPERGVRVELRLAGPEPWRGSVYASQKIVADRALWRLDLLESVERGPGSKDRMHHHPGMSDNEPHNRVFDRDLTADPIGFLERTLQAPGPILERAGLDPAAHDLAALSAALPEIVGTARTTLEEVRAGRLATAPAGGAA